MAKNKRKAKKMTAEELETFIHTKFEEVGEEFEEDYFDIYTLLQVGPKIKKDVAKVQFDFENTTITPGDFRDFMPLVGWNEIDDFAFLGIAAGGDWECPVFFIVYVDHTNTLRGYVPMDGNVFNKKTKEAFGNDEEADDLAAKEFGFDSYEELYDADNIYDFDKIQEDIFNRIEVV